jgi:translation elongation factor EF-Tu-like GTPase
MDEILRLPITDAFAISGRGAVLTGVIESGATSVGDRVVVISPSKRFEAVVAGVEIDRKILSTAKRGDAVGVLIRSYDASVVRDCSVETGEKTPEGRPVLKITSIVVQHRPRKWWEIWK